jgi:hypothetical protein
MTAEDLDPNTTACLDKQLSSANMVCWWLAFRVVEGLVVVVIAEADTSTVGQAMRTK